MKKDYEAPKAEKLEFNYSEVVTASGCGGIYQEYKDDGEGCNKTPTGNWTGAYSSESRG